MNAATQNARTHGFTAEQLTVPAEHIAEFESFRDSLLAALTPQGTIEEFLFRRLLHAAWNLEKIDQAEAGLFAGPAALLTDEQEKTLSRLARYRASHLRVYQYAKRSLEYEQTQRALRNALHHHTTAQEGPAPEPPPCANLRQISNFAKQELSLPKFSTLTPELRDQLWAMSIETRHSTVRLREYLYHARQAA